MNERLLEALKMLLATADDTVWLHNTTNGQVCRCKSCAKKLARELILEAEKPQVAK